MAFSSKKRQSNQTPQIDLFPSSPLALYGCHLGMLSLGAFIGIFAVFYFDFLHPAFKWDLRAAKELGIISLTILAGYPKSKDVVVYLVTLGLPILFSLSLWLLWVKGKRQAELRRLLEGSPQNAQEVKRGWVPWVLLVIACYLFVSFNIGYFYRPSSGWPFLGEEGSHFAYIQSMLSGGVYGKEFTCPYGPMMIYPMFWLVKLFGTTVVVARTYTYLLNLIAYGLILLIFYRFLASKAIFFLASIVYLAAFPPHTLPAPQWSYLRVILGVFSLILVDLSFRNHKRYLLFIAGLLTGQSLLFSQEVGVCSLFSQLACLFLNRFPDKEWKEGRKEVLILLASTFFSVLPMLTAFYFKGVFSAVLKNIYENPKYFALGYGSLPFLGLRDFFKTPTADGMLFAYWIIFVYVVSAIFLLSSAFLFPNTRSRSLKICVLLFGILLFRSFLGRSDGHHAHFVSPPVFFLVFLLLDDTWRNFRNRPFVFLKAGSVLWGAVLLLPLLFLFSRPEALKNPIREVITDTVQFRQKVSLPADGRRLPEIVRGGILFDSATAESLKRIFRFLQEKTTPGEYTYFFPNEAGYYFLFNRNNPTRYPCAFHAATRAQREELVGDLEQKKPKYIVRSLSTAHIDGITEEMQVPEVAAYLKKEYVLDSEQGDILILKRKGM
jgi:hypothetical protein